MKETNICMHKVAHTERQARHGFGRVAIALEYQDGGFRARTTRGMDCKSRMTQTSCHECSRAWTLSAIVPLISITNQPPGRRAACAWGIKRSITSTPVGPAKTA